MAFQLIGSWNMSLLSWCWFKDKYKEGMESDELFVEFKDKASYYYQYSEALEKVKAGIMKKAKADPKWFEDRITYYAELFERDKKELVEINALLQGPSPDLVFLFEKYWRLFSNMVFGMGIDLYFDDIVAKRVFNNLSEKMTAIGKTGKIHEYYTIITAPQKATTSLQEEIDFLEIVNQAQELPSGQIQQLLCNHLQKYAFIPVWFDSPAWNLTDLSERLKKERTGDFRKKLQNTKNLTQTNSKKTTEMFKELKPDKAFLHDVTLLKDFSFIRQQGEVQIGYNTYYGTPLKDKIAKKFGIPLEQLNFLTPEEIVAFLENQEYNQVKSLVKTRQQYVFLITRDGKCEVLTGKTAFEYKQKLPKELIPSQIQPNSIVIRASVGSVGYTTGNARILLSYQDAAKLKEGEIMIVSGLSVEYIDP